MEKKVILILERKIYMWVDTENVLKVLNRTGVSSQIGFQWLLFSCFPPT